MKVNCPECRKRFASDEYLKLHMGYAHPVPTGASKSKGWATPYGFIDSAEPITYDEACAAMKEVLENTFWDEGKKL